MLLYRFAKMMEEHSELRRTIHRAEGDVDDLLQQKEQMEEELLAYSAVEVQMVPDWDAMV